MIKLAQIKKNEEFVKLNEELKKEADKINRLNIDKMIKALPFYLAKGLEFEGVISIYFFCLFCYILL